MGVKTKTQYDASDAAFGIGVILITIALVVGLVATIHTLATYDPQKSAEAEFQQRNRIVQSCLESEIYTRAECITLAGVK